MRASTEFLDITGLSAKDARVLDSELRCDSDFLLKQRKGQSHTEFACYVRNYTGNALSVRIPLGYVDSLPALDAESYAELLEGNRARYTAPPVLPQPAAFTSKKSPAKAEMSPTRIQPSIPPDPAPEITVLGPGETEPDERGPLSGPEIPLQVAPEHPQQPRTQAARLRKAAAPKEPLVPGRGGQQHKYLQHLVKQLAEERGFRASVEESILDGAGQVDVSLLRGKQRIACEISITTTHDQELGNIEKCLASGYTDIVLIGSNERHLKSLSKLIEENLEESDRGKVIYLTPERLPEYLDSLGVPPASSEQMVKGYKVRTVHQIVDPAQAGARRQAVAQVIARSLKKGNKD